MLIDTVEISCCDCGVVFWIADQHNKELLRSKKTFHCPNGHSQNYTGKSDKVKLAEEKKNSDRYYKYYEAQMEKNTKLKNQIKGYKGQLKRQQNKERKT